MDAKPIVRKTIDLLEKRLYEPLTLEEISQTIGYSRFHLNRLFAAETGMTISRYIRRRRLTLAAEKLIGTDRSIADIACEAGYDSQQAFTLAFKQLYLCPPNAYRARGISRPKQNRIELRMQRRAA